MEKVPKHVAIVMDGNGRWAQERRRPRFWGHVRGVQRVRPVVREADRLGVRALTLFAFSTENWSRPQAEKDIIFRLLEKDLRRRRAELKRENVRLRFFGDFDRLSKSLKHEMQLSVEELKHCTGLNLNVALSYGSRNEIIQAAQQFARDCVHQKKDPDSLTEDQFWQYLITADLGDLSDVDLVIRTSGERRISNFLLWQAAYAEYVFPETYWPDFRPEDLREAVEDFGKRERRYGRVGFQAERAYS